MQQIQCPISFAAYRIVNAIMEIDDRMQGLEMWRNARARYAGAVACLVLYLTAAGTAFAGSAGKKVVMQGGSNGCHWGQAH